MKREKLSREDFLKMNETEREAWLKVPLKRFVFSIVNRWNQYSAYRIDFAPSLHVLKQLKSKSISIDWLGFCISLQINKIEKNVSLEITEDDIAAISSLEIQVD